MDDLRKKLADELRGSRDQGRAGRDRDHDLARPAACHHSSMRSRLPLQCCT